MTNPNVQALINTGKQLTKNSNIKAYMERLKQLSENEKRHVLSEVKTSYHNTGKSNVWTLISKEMNGGKRKTRKSKKASKKTRKHRKH